MGEKPLTPEEIQEMAHTYLANYSLVDKNHEFFQTREVIGVPVESYITQEPISLKGLDGKIREYPPGTWIATTKITDPDEIQKALNGEYTGYSVTTISKKFADKQIKIPKRVLMKDIPDPVGFTISLVKNPCVSGAKFCNMKSDDGVVMNENIDEQLENETKGFLQSIKGILNKQDESSEDKDKDFITKEDFETFKKELRQDVDKSLESVNTTIKSVDEAVKNINSTLDSLKPQEDEEDEDDKGTNEGNATEAEDDKGTDEGNAGTEGETTEGNSSNVQSSKSIPNHDVNRNATPRKTGTARVYEIMGRDATGSAIRKQ